MLRLDKIFFDAITADAELMQAVGGRVKSTCFEVSPDEQDNTPLPYILILDAGKQPAQTTKDDEWMPSQWRVGAGVEVGAKSPNEVDALVMKAMKAIAEYSSTIADQGEEIPYPARIVSVADTYDAMTSDRSYRKALKDEVALKELRDCSGTQFDPAIVAAFLALCAHYRDSIREHVSEFAIASKHSKGA